jgi:hypothetical protein
MMETECGEREGMLDLRMWEWKMRDARSEMEDRRGRIEGILLYMY